MKPPVRQIGLVIVLTLAVDVYMFGLTDGYVSAVLLGIQTVVSVYAVVRLRTLDRKIFFLVEAELRVGNPIIREVWEDLLHVTAYMCLLMPGALSDLFGAMILQPVVRSWMADALFYDAH